MHTTGVGFKVFTLPKIFSLCTLLCHTVPFPPKKKGKKKIKGKNKQQQKGVKNLCPQPHIA